MAGGKLILKKIEKGNAPNPAISLERFSSFTYSYSGFVSESLCELARMTME